MNTQRWLAMLIVVSVAGIIATRPLWLATLQPEEEDAVDQDTTDSGEPLPTLAPLPTPGGAAANNGQALLPATELMEEGAMMEEEMVEAAESALGTGGPFILAAGEFVQIDAMHGGEGAATIYQAPDGARFVRLEPFSVTDAPDLRVALSSNLAPRTQNDLASSSGFLDLGSLESTLGAQNYDIPPNVRLEQFQSVVIYERQFNIVFTVATLER